MLDGLSLDQLRAFVAAVDEGSFSAAARRLGRAQSMVSDLIARLEAQLGLTLFDRSGRLPRLTAAGQAVLGDARDVLGQLHYMRARASGMATGLEAELSVVFDAMYPIGRITAAAVAFRDRFPATPLRLSIEMLGNSFAPLLNGRAAIGIVGPAPPGLDTLATEPLAAVPVVMVAAASHPLARLPAPIARQALSTHIQLVLTDRSPLSEGLEYYVLSNSSWRLSDLMVKRAFLIAGLGWGGMPRHAIAADLADGSLVKLVLADLPAEGLRRPMQVAYPIDTPPGPAGRWLIDHLRAAERVNKQNT